MLLPAIVDTQIRQGITDYLHTTFPITTPHLAGLLEGLIAEPGGIFKGPYVSLALPFRKGSGRQDYFRNIPFPFPPYSHQESAFARLAGDSPQSTLVATGTGSGKTECFLWPILDYCARRAPSSGIKAILIYPMNALAGDQARRIARILWANPALKGKVTAGLYVGGEEGEPRTSMGPEMILTDRETMRQSPPDLLLTNYKMLDYLLQRPRDKPLWATTDAAALRYLVVDELHTFDGAQGTDLACLIRRLKHRVGLAPGRLCCVGTSATLGSGPDHGARLVEYAGRIFGESFPGEAIITEQRQRAREFLSGAFVRYEPMPGREHTEVMLGEGQPARNEKYLAAQLEIWFHGEMVAEPFEAADWRVALGQRLKELPLLRSVLEILDGRIRPADEVCEELGQIYREFGEERDAAPEAARRYRLALLMSLFSMVSAARTQEGERIAPFLQVRFQTWLRELRRMTAEVSAAPRMRFSADLGLEQRENHLPVVHCRECGAAGWAGSVRKNRPTSVRADLQEFYPRFFAERVSLDVIFLFPGDAEDFQESGIDGQFRRLCSHCLELDPKEPKCPQCGADTIRVFVPVNRRQVKSGEKTFLVGTKDCPGCGARNSLMLIGAQSASLASVALNQLFASRFNGDKKALAFSDNVQDASHRVGFFSARTWRFNLRAAIRQYLEQCEPETPLDAFLEGFTAERRRTLGDADFAAVFTPRDMMWLEAFEQLTEEKDDSLLPRLVDMVTRRVHWEILAEFGFDCRRGRTLEKSGSAVLLPVVAWEAAIDALGCRLENGHERLRGQLTPLRLQHFLLGLVEYVRRRGGIFNPMLETYLASEGQAYVLSNKPWMPNYGPGMRLPVFFSEEPLRRARSPFESWTDPNDWIRRWAVKLFLPLDAFVVQSAFDILRAGFEVLGTFGPLGKEEGENRTIWGLSPAGCRVTADVTQLRCSRCGHQLSLGSAHAVGAEGMPCFKPGCLGRYAALAARRDYYDELYRHGDIVRLFAEEHTGLVSRREREKTETRFKATQSERRLWYPNLISCTPTLEMGIDIGDLSTVLLCSTPPSQTTYLQRIGRAGRTDGNALALNIALAAPHDLYFYEDPLEMMAGEVATPGVYLGAMAVLERQLTAFCLDCWVHENDTIDIPSKMTEVIARVERKRTELFPWRFYSFVQQHHQRLLASFCGLFDQELADEAREYLATYLGGGEQTPLTIKVHNGILGLRDSREALRKKLQTVRRKLDRIRKDPAASEEEKGSLAREEAALRGLVRSINDKETLNFFTDEGLVPNYAFPESGVILRSVIYRRKERGEGGAWATREYEYQRAASQAISELVPGSVFYAGGRHVTIDQIDVTLSQPEDWRFCPNCNHMERKAAEEAAKECPQCGAAGWFDGGQVQPLLKVRQVFANTSDRESLTRDDSDEREQRYYLRHLFVDFKPEDIEGAWSVENEEITFGFEFLRKTTFREINFGERTSEETQGILVAGQSYAASGFLICRYCGTIQKRNAAKPVHAHFCPARDKETEKNLLHVLYLYREFQSESIRFLIPAVTEGVERKMHSFLAALMMGLREQYRGDVGHLTTCVYDEPVPGNSGQRKRYVVLYDTVPGGTGYLKQLTKDKDLVFGLLEKALRKIRNCDCRRKPDRDGCYRCLLVYRNAHAMDAISRETAEELLGSILANRQGLQQIQSLSGITMNRILESELEKKFIQALDERVKKEGGLFIQEMHDNKPCWRLEFAGDGARWLIEPQVEIAVPGSMAILCRADFLLQAQGKDGPKIALFTDGYSFHRERVGLDMRQRMILLRHPERYWTWSLSWRDIDQFQNGTAYSPDFNLLQRTREQEAFYKAFCERLNQAPTTTAPTDRSAMYWLVDFLKSPDSDAWMRVALAQTMARMKPEDREEPERTRRLAELKKMLPASVSGPEEKEAGAVVLIGGKERLRQNHRIHPQAMMNPSKWPQAVETFLILEDGAAEEDDFERIWNEYLRMADLYQFLPGSFFLTRTDMKAGKYEDFDLVAGFAPSADEKAIAGLPAVWSEAMELARDESVRKLLEHLCAAGGEVPVVGYELLDETHRACATAELAWESPKIAYLVEDEERAVFEKQGWVVVNRGEEEKLGKQKAEVRRQNSE